jgi:UDP-N-acetylmuramyl pentapeptide phosphotransferase/UDP-N-acetylglucosamine-1-phosphate transferase
MPSDPASASQQPSTRRSRAREKRLRGRLAARPRATQEPASWYLQWGVAYWLSFALMNGVISFAADEQARLSLLLLFLAGALSPWLLRRFPIFGSDSGEGSERKLQREAIPLVGAATLGIPLLYYAAADKLGTRALHLWQEAMPLWILAAIVCTLALGILDDRKRGGLAPLPKLGLQTLTGLLLGLGMLSWLSASSSAPEPPLRPVLIVVLPIFLVVLLQNAWNFFDNFDGAAIWVALLSCTLLFTDFFASSGSSSTSEFQGQLHEPHVTGLALFLILPLLGTLLWNWPRARCYLGDAGSHLLGLGFAMMTTYAAVTTRVVEEGNGWSSWCLDYDLGHVLAALLILNAVPLLDLVQVSVVRLARGIPPWRGDRRHLAHRLAQIFPAPMVAVLLALLQILLSLSFFHLFVS